MLQDDQKLHLRPLGGGGREEARRRRQLALPAPPPRGRAAGLRPARRPRQAQARLPQPGLQQVQREHAEAGGGQQPRQPEAARGADARQGLGAGPRGAVHHPAGAAGGPAEDAEPGAGVPEHPGVPGEPEEPRWRVGQVARRVQERQREPVGGRAGRGRGGDARVPVRHGGRGQRPVGGRPHQHHQPVLGRDPGRRRAPGGGERRLRGDQRGRGRRQGRGGGAQRHRLHGGGGAGRAGGRHRGGGRRVTNVYRTKGLVFRRGGMSSACPTLHSRTTALYRY